MRRAPRIDANHTEVVEALRAIGCTVASLAACGKGVPDLLVGRHGKNYLLEVKDGSKPASARKLTQAQADWHREWRGNVIVVFSAEEAVGAVRY